MSFQNSLTCIMGCLMVYSVGEFLPKETKGAVSSLLFVCVLFPIGFRSGLLPKDITTQSGLVAVMANFGTAFIITNIGTLTNLEDLIREWKTVVISLFIIAAIALICLTAGSLLFERGYALIAMPPAAGSTVAGIIVTSAAEAANRLELVAFAVLVLSVQKFFGIPISTFCIRKELRIKHDGGFFRSNTVEEKSSLRLPSMRIFKETPKNLKSNTIYICKVALVAYIADFVEKATLIPGSSPANYILNPNITYLLFGLIFARIGFLEKDIFAKANSSGIITFGPLLMLPGNLATLSPSGLLSTIVPVFGILLICSIGIIIICGIVGRVLGYFPYTSAAVGVTCMLAYPATQIITTEGVDSFEQEGDERQKTMDYILPKVIIGGFVTVTIVSVTFASIIGPIVFQRKERLSI